jgi:excisionase family DNA binding protein
MDHPESPECMAAYRQLALEYPNRFADLLGAAGTGGTGLFTGAKYMTVAEMADEMRVSKMTVHRLLRSGAMDSIRFGGTIRVTVQSFRAFLANHPAYTEETDASG